MLFSSMVNPFLLFRRGIRLSTILLLRLTLGRRTLFHCAPEPVVNIRATAPLHFGHRFSGAAEMDWNASN